FHGNPNFSAHAVITKEINYEKIHCINSAGPVAHIV
ncbi:MAG: hypothetical protein ACI9C4_003018, partial [Paraglaciecola sp.]